MKKKLTTLALILIAALSMLALCACNSGPSSEEVIREGLSEEFDMIVNKKGDDWDEMISDIEEEADLSMFGIDAEEFVNVLFDGFDYEITSVDVDEEDDTAVAHVTLTSKSMKDVMDALEEAANDFLVFLATLRAKVALAAMVVRHFFPVPRHTFADTVHGAAHIRRRKHGLAAFVAGILDPIPSHFHLSFLSIPGRCSPGQ